MESSDFWKLLMERMALFLQERIKLINTSNDHRRILEVCGN